MNKFVTFEGIGYVAATFPVSSATKTYLETNHTNPKTGNVDINGKNLASFGLTGVCWAALRYLRLCLLSTSVSIFQKNISNIS